MQKSIPIFFLLFFYFFCCTAIAQEINVNNAVAPKQLADSSNNYKKAAKKFNPRTATIRSAILPGWGQIYNKKYWKLPLVYGALGTTAGIFVYNVKTYKLLKLAYLYKSDSIPANDVLIDPKFKNLSATALRSYRNTFRQNVDYSVLFFLIFWGLNVVDATVDAHLKSFDVNDNLSFQMRPGYSQMANTAGISFVLNIHPKALKALN